jgi:hypothetical protein
MRAARRRAFPEPASTPARLYIRLQLGADFPKRVAVLRQLRHSITVDRKVGGHPAVTAICVETVIKTGMDQIVAKLLATMFTFAWIKISHRLGRILHAPAAAAIHGRKKDNGMAPENEEWWRRGELNPRPRDLVAGSLHA